MLRFVIYINFAGFVFIINFARFLYILENQIKLRFMQPYPQAQQQSSSARQKSQCLKSSKYKSTFKLMASLNLNDDRLEITLYDYIDYTIYSKSFTQADIGKEIHKRVVLNDLFNSLSSGSQIKSSEHSLQEVDKCDSKWVYNFGDIAYVDQVPCYKLEKNGKLTVFVNFYDRNTKKNIIFESVLLLNKSSAMKLEQIKNHNEQNNKKQKSNLSQKQQKSYIDQINKLTTQLRQSIQSLTQQKQRIRQCIKIWNDQPYKNYQGCEQLRRSYYQNSRYQLLKFYEKNQKNNKQFRVIKKMIEYIGATSEYVQYYLDFPIPRKDSFKLSVRLVRVTGKVCIGLIDFNKCKDRRSSLKQGYAIYLQTDITNSKTYLHNFDVLGRRPNPSTTQTIQRQLQQDSILQMQIQNNKISWYVLAMYNGQYLIVESSLDVFNYQNCMLVPSIQLCNPNDIVEVQF